jgi:hypothetical protein
MNMRNAMVALTACTLLGSATAHAQNEEDALRIGTVRPGGTARSAGLANAFGAVGADPAAFGINPAGFGLYRTSELSITPVVEVNDADATFYGITTGDTRSRFAFNNIALIINDPAKAGSDWRSSTYGVVLDRQESHNRRTQAVGRDVNSTFLEGLALDAGGIRQGDLYDALPFTSGLAWETYAINPAGDSLSTVYFPAIPFGSPTEQLHTIDARGANTSTGFFYAGNYQDKLYVGLSLGIASHRYRRTTVHEETSLDGTVDLRTATWKEELNTTGSGFHVSAGALGRVTERLRLGAAFHSPQWMLLSDAYLSDMVTTFRSPDSLGRDRYTSASPDGIFTYRVQTPWRAVASAAYIAGSNGLVSVDYEFHDPRKARFRPSDRLLDSYNYRFENDAIRSSFTPVHSLRVGTEWRFGTWYYRMGWALATDPYAEQDARRGSAWKNYAGGVGYRDDHLAVDLGVNVGLQQDRYFPYNAALVNSTAVDRRDLRFMLTVSLRT